MRHDIRSKEINLFETQLHPGAFRQAKVRIVDRVERSAENSNSHLNNAFIYTGKRLRRLFHRNYNDAAFAFAERLEFDFTANFRE